MKPSRLWIRPTMIPVEPVFECIEQGAERCADDVTEGERPQAAQRLIRFGWLQFRWLRSRSGLSPGS